MWADPFVTIRLACIGQAERMDQEEPRDGTGEHPGIDAMEEESQQGQLAGADLDLDALQDVQGCQLSGNRSVVGLKTEVCQTDQIGVSQLS